MENTFGYKEYYGGFYLLLDFAFFFAEMNVFLT